MTNNRKRWLICLLAIFAVCTVFAGGCAKKEIIKKDNNVTVSPLPLILTTTINAAYTRAFHDYVSGTLMFAYMPPVGIINPPVHAIAGEFDLYFWPDYANTGFFVGPQFQVSYTMDNRSEGYLGGTGVIPGVGLGYRWLWENGFNIGLGGSFGYIITVDKPDCPAGFSCTEHAGIAGFNNFAPRILFDLGYAF